MPIFGSRGIAKSFGNFFRFSQRQETNRIKKQVEKALEKDKVTKEKRISHGYHGSGRRSTGYVPSGRVAHQTLKSLYGGQFRPLKPIAGRKRK